MIRWEYLVVDLARCRGSRQIADTLTTYGHYGWELASVTCDPMAGHLAYMKRLIPDPEERIPPQRAGFEEPELAQAG